MILTGQTVGGMTVQFKYTHYNFIADGNSASIIQNNIDQY